MERSGRSELKSPRVMEPEGPLAGSTEPVIGRYPKLLDST
jgi:hypothetical protein